MPTTNGEKKFGHVNLIFMAEKKSELKENKQVKEFTEETDFIPFRYQGQYHDIETGLFYNTFRYYDPESGNYTQIDDPIGLVGGMQLYGYVHDTNTFIDIFGL